MTQAERIRAFIIEQVPRHPKDIVAVAEKHFGVTRTTVHRHLNKLLQDGRVLKAGRTNTTVYSLRSSINKRLDRVLSPSLSESDLWAENYRFLEDSVSKNVFDICEYGFTEMVNNAKDHSQGTSVHIESLQEDDNLEFRISDDGIGIFRKIKQTFNLADERESLLQLSKGKLTTDPANHSGQGIFFTSRAFDEFTILANGLLYQRDNKQEDWFVETKSDRSGGSTLITMKINVRSNRKLKDVFDQYSDPGADYSFNKTDIYVDLSRSNEERFVSRSQAKRVLMDLEKFKRVVLDFKGVTAVGQAFVDEVFRVFKNKHPDIQIDYVNANEDVEFMIKRGVSTSF
jgi:anti-sigma regulatory factor (Ser/Thr protein kinase)